MTGTEQHILIIGSGGGAFAAAIRAVEAGARVTMVEAGAIGGTCVNVGCIPSKITLRAAEIQHRRGHHPFNGIATDTAAADSDALLAQIRGRVAELRESKYEAVLDAYDDIEYVSGVARFEDASTVTVAGADGDVQRFRPDRILIATGASPAVPPVEGLADTPYWTSTEALFTPERPAHLIVLGSSFVALELAQAYRRLGSAVTVIARSTLLSRNDPDAGEAIQTALEAEGVRVLTQSVPDRIEHTGDGFRVLMPGESISGERLLVATGHRPNTEGLNPAAAGIDTDADGAIPVGPDLRTATDGIYAVGDCTTLPKLVYVAAAAGTRAAINMTGGDTSLDLSVVPVVVFTDPQVATVGLDETQARAEDLTPDTRRLDLANVPRALANFDTQGFIKLIAEADSGRLIGARIVAHNAGETIQTAALAIRHRMTVDALADELFPYLTFSEGLKLCAQTFRKDVSKLSCCAG